MKKFLALLLTLVMALSLAACGGSDEESTGAPPKTPPPMRNPAARRGCQDRFGQMSILKPEFL